MSFIGTFVAYELDIAGVHVVEIYHILCKLASEMSLLEELTFSVCPLPDVVCVDNSIDARVVTSCPTSHDYLLLFNGFTLLGHGHRFEGLGLDPFAVSSTDQHPAA